MNYGFPINAGYLAHTKPPIVMNISIKKKILFLNAGITGANKHSKVYKLVRGQEVPIIPHDYLAMQDEIIKYVKLGDVRIVRDLSNEVNDHDGETIQKQAIRVDDPDQPVNGMFWLVHKLNGFFDMRVKIAGGIYSLIWNNGAVNPHVATFVSTDWQAAAGGYHRMVIPQTTHLKGITPHFNVYEKEGTEYKEVKVDDGRLLSNGNIELKVSAADIEGIDTDGRFDGRIVIV